MAESTPFRSPLLALGLGLALLSGPACALYKVVGPDGKVSYTDRPAAASGDKVIGINPDGPATGSGEPVSPALPLALRQVAGKFPVVLYVTTPDCEPCNSGRQFLRQRGIPHAERSVTTPEDAEALQRLTGGKETPTLSVGSQVLRGFSTSEWAQYLDAAGYPATSTLPAGYKSAAATPLAPPRTTAVAPAPRVIAPAPSAATSPSSAQGATPANPAGIRF
jgi:glutaredoxin